MNKTVSMVDNHLFRRLYRIGNSVVTPFFVVYYKKTKLDYNRLGITATKKIGNAVERNRARRITKEAYRLIEDRVIYPCDIVIVLRKKAVFSNMQKIRKLLEQILITDGK